MPNPTPGVLATGKYSSRAVLAAAVGFKRRRGANWTEIARDTGTSVRTAKRCFEEDQLAHEQARKRAYKLASEAAPAVKVPASPTLPPASQPTTGFKGAVWIYVAAGLVLIAIAVALTVR